jgi:hypothetical protein
LYDIFNTEIAKRTKINTIIFYLLNPLIPISVFSVLFVEKTGPIKAQLASRHLFIFIVVREGRLELPLCLQSWILSPVRLPIPPLSHLLKKKEIQASDLGRLTMEDKIFIKDSLDFNG